jgi:glycosyltransferase involved in cell wall biosynthesis
MPQVIEEFPLVKFVVLGKGEAYDPLLHLAERLNVKKNLLLRSEFVSEEERILHYAMSDICVFPSISEPFGIVSLEAMSMGKPVVVGARGVSGFKEQVIPNGPNQSGIHINGENPIDIAWGIKEILSDPKRGIYWGRNGRKHVLQYFTWKQAAEKTLNVYREAIG